MHDASLDDAEVAAEAYALFLARGGQHGDDVGDWLAAEAIVRQRHQNGASYGAHDHEGARESNEPGEPREREVITPDWAALEPHDRGRADDRSEEERRQGGRRG